MLASQQGSVQQTPIGSGWVALTSLQLVIALGLFALDILTPFGVADGIAYSTLIVLCLWSPDRRVSLIWTLFSILLIFGGWFFSQDPPALSLVSRLLSAGTVVLIWALVRSRTRDIEALQTRELESRQASASKTAFLANMSHELRTPLNAIMGFSDLMRMNITISEEKRREYLSDIHRSAQHLLAIIADVLDLVKMGAGQLRLKEKTFSLNALVAEVAQLNSILAANRHLDVSIDAAQLPDLRADERLVKQIILNLLSNAMKFTKAGGRIVLSTGLTKGKLWFAVSDTGIGIPKDTIPQLGRPFHRAGSALTNAISGTGLGLALCCQFMEAHGGALQIDSVENKGTTITVTFPLERTVDLPSVAAVAA